MLVTAAGENLIVIILQLTPPPSVPDHLDFRTDPDHGAAGSLPKSSGFIPPCRHYSFCQVFWKAAGDSMRNANQICIRDCININSYPILRTDKRKKISQRQLRSVVRELIPFGALSRRGLTPIKLAYDLHWPDGRLH